LSAPVTQQARNDVANNADQRKTRVFRPARTVMPRVAAARQLRLTTVAWSTLRTPERVKAFLNSDHATLSARPIDVAIASDTGLARVEQLLDVIRAHEAVAV
jgi:hypothetical protein